MFLDWLLKTEEGNISYEELKMSAQDRCMYMESMKMETYHMAEHYREMNL